MKNIILTLFSWGVGGGKVSFVLCFRIIACHQRKPGHKQTGQKTWRPGPTQRVWRSAASWLVFLDFLSLFSFSFYCFFELYIFLLCPPFLLLPSYHTVTTPPSQFMPSLVFPLSRGNVLGCSTNRKTNTKSRTMRQVDFQLWLKIIR